MPNTYGTQPWEMQKPAVLGIAADLNVPAGNTAAVVTYAAGAGNLANAISGVIWSYSAAPSGGLLTITDGSTVIREVAIIAGGQGQIHFDPPLKGSPASALILTLAAGGGVIVGIVQAEAHWQE